jgi:hypothetical protein
MTKLTFFQKIHLKFIKWCDRFRSRNAQVNPSGIYLINYFIQHYINETMDYNERYDKIISDTLARKNLEDTAENRIRCVLTYLRVLFGALPKEKVTEIIDGVENENARENMRMLYL